MQTQSKSSVSLVQHQKLISNIYDAALEPGQWKKMLENLMLTFNGEQATLRIIDSTSNTVLLHYDHNKDPIWNKLYREYYIHQDPWLNKILKNGKAAIACTHHFLQDKEYEKLGFYRDFVGPQGTHYGLGGRIHVDKNITGFIAINRNRNKWGFESEYMSSLQFLTPHIQKALLINDRTHNVELKQNLLRDALNKINNPIVLVNKNGEILFINSQAEKLIEQQAGIAIQNNHVYILSQADNKKLNKLIHQATDPNSLLQQGGGLHFTHPTDQASMSILVSPINPNRVNNDTQSNENALLVLSSHNQWQPLSADLLSSLYDLTRAEARLTVSLCQGLTLDDMANKFSLSKNTLRSQLRSCFNKTGVSRQAELIRYISEGPAGSIKTIEAKDPH